jgi:bifunctional DNA-binding transcriptional regulator/antitoxin component of YhaV-PrlF toxin-antitoxin module
MWESRVGSKGELFPPKEIREKLGPKACTKVLYKIDSGRLIVETVPTIKEILQENTPIEITLEEFQKQRRELSEKLNLHPLRNMR